MFLFKDIVKLIVHVQIYLFSHKEKTHSLDLYFKYLFDYFALFLLFERVREDSANTQALYCEYGASARCRFSLFRG